MFPNFFRIFEENYHKGICLQKSNYIHGDTMKLKLDEIIMRSGMKKGYIAKELKISRDTLTNWIKERSMIPLDKAVELARLLEVDIKELYEEE